MNVLAISGSLRKASYNTALLKAARTVAPDGMSIDIATLDDIPLYNGDADGPEKPPAISELGQAIRAADGVLMATPEYNFSVSGVLKNAIDWVSRIENQPLAGKPLGIMGAAAGGLGTARAQYHLRQVFVYLDARVMNRPELFVGGAYAKFDSDGNLTDDDTSKFLTAYLLSFQNWVARSG
ncbi:MAG: NAD(P)H-dependent oxidoreductase [Hyphomicrobiales bacterium]|nr:NAD(P)H-dependent oxidoreductase [Hyphomicrobiales bacterium]